MGPLLSASASTIHTSNTIEAMIDTDRDWFALLAPQLAVAVAVLEEGHITRAAERLGMNQPTVSRMMQRLEEGLDVSLVQPHGRGVLVTAAGKAFLPAARQTLATLRAARQELGDVVDPGRGQIALAFLHSLGAWEVPRLVDAFRAAWPDVRFVLSQGAADDILHQMHRGEIDIVITAPLPEADGDHGTVALSEQDLFLTVPTEHRLAERQRIDLRQVASERFVALTPGHGLRAVFDTLCEEAGFAPQLEFLGQDIATLRGLVGAGLGLAVLPHGRFEDAHTVQVPIRRPRAHRTVGAVWPLTRMLPPSARRFTDFLARDGARVLREADLAKPSG
jgi:LysR family transcriptional activator of glutamate synthase operon